MPFILGFTIHLSGNHPVSDTNLVRVSETMNQFYARNTYNKFLKKIGGHASYKETILAEGFGYQYEVANLRATFSHYNISEKDAVKRISHIFATGAREDDMARLSQYLIQKGVPASKADTLLGELSKNTADFNGVLKGAL